MRESFPAVRSRTAPLSAALVGALAVAGSYAVAGTDPAFLVAPVHSLVVDLTPAPVLAFSILVLGDVGDLLGFLLALAVAVAALGAVALAGFALGRRYGTAAALGTVYFGTWGLTALLTGAPWTALGAAVPATLGVWLFAVRPLDRLGARVGPIEESRRQVVRLLGVAGFSGFAFAVGRRMPFRTPRLSVISAEEQATIRRRLRSARGRSLELSGIDGLVTPVGEFYEVDVDTINPSVDVGDWTLDVSGAVETERSLTYDDLTARSPEHRFTTLRCVGEPLNGEKMDTALWTGVPVDDVLAAAGVAESATHVRLRAVDGYYETFPLAAIRGGLLAYGMNGYLLPRSHGYPVRALVPGHWGEVNVKWLTGIDVLEREAESYWEKRGWHGTGPVKTVAKLHAVERIDDGRIRVGGHAYAGTRGIGTVQVSTDGGGTWNDATLSAPLPDADVWRQWAYAYRPPAGEHEVVVRAVDGDGALQSRYRSRAFPAGASGWVSKRIQP
ncbi:MAG: molybdopterin-dependent oxidoreductase [Salinigranum sp.]